METKGINPMDDPEKCAGIIKKERQDIMIVGHLPNLSKVVSLMVIGDTERQIAAFSFSCVICIEKQPDGSWTMAPVFSL
jgi:phosphohistidine phosphatase